MERFLMHEGGGLCRVLWGSFLMVLLAASFANAASITVYSHRHYKSDELLFKRFEAKTGIGVKVVKAGADELIGRLKAEGRRSPADVLITADAGRLYQAKLAGVLRAVDSDFLKARVPSHLRDPEGYWFGFTKRARVLVYAKDRVRRSELSSYEALLEPKWKGRVLVRSSGNVYNQSLLASLIVALGAEKAQAWAMGLRMNMARRPQGSDRDQMRAIATGLGDVAIVNTYYLGLLLHSENPADRRVGASLGVFFPNQKGRGTHVNVSGAGMTKACRSPSAAKAFLEFLASDEAQGTFPLTNFEYPVVRGVEWSELLKSWGDFKEDGLNLSQLGKLNAQAVRIFNKVGWQ